MNTEIIKNMIARIDWRALGKALWAAAKPVLLGALGGGMVATTSGCSSLVPATRGQHTEIFAVGIPAVAWISHSTQTATHAGGDTNGVVQANAQQVNVPITAAK